MSSMKDKRKSREKNKEKQRGRYLLYFTFNVVFYFTLHFYTTIYLSSYKYKFHNLFLRYRNRSSFPLLIVHSRVPRR